MTCSGCAGAIAVSDKFCGYCGTKTQSRQLVHESIELRGKHWDIPMAFFGIAGLLSAVWGLEHVVNSQGGQLPLWFGVSAMITVINHRRRGPIVVVGRTGIAFNGKAVAFETLSEARIESQRPLAFMHTVLVELRGQNDDVHRLCTDSLSWAETDQLAATIKTAAPRLKLVVKKS